MDLSTEQHGEWSTDLAGAEDLLDQPDGDEPMEHSGLKTDVKRPPVQPVGAGNATAAVKITDSPNVVKPVPSRTNSVGGNDISSSRTIWWQILGNSKPASRKNGLSGPFGWKD